MTLKGVSTYKLRAAVLERLTLSFSTLGSLSTFLPSHVSGPQVTAKTNGQMFLLPPVYCGVFLILTGGKGGIFLHFL